LIDKGYENVGKNILRAVSMERFGIVFFIDSW